MGGESWQRWQAARRLPEAQPERPPVQRRRAKAPHSALAGPPCRLARPPLPLRPPRCTGGSPTTETLCRLCRPATWASTTSAERCASPLLALQPAAPCFLLVRPSPPPARTTLPRRWGGAALPCLAPAHHSVVLCGSLSVTSAGLASRPAVWAHVSGRLRRHGGRHGLPQLHVPPGPLLFGWAFGAAGLVRQG